MHQHQFVLLPRHKRRGFVAQQSLQLIPQEGKPWALPIGTAFDIKATTPCRITEVDGEKLTVSKEISLGELLAELEISATMSWSRIFMLPCSEILKHNHKEDEAVHDKKPVGEIYFIRDFNSDVMETRICKPGKEHQLKNEIDGCLEVYSMKFFAALAAA